MKHLLTTLLLILIMPAFAAEEKEEEEKIYELEFETDSNWTSLEIRDDAVFVNAPADKSMSITAKDG